MKNLLPDEVMYLVYGRTLLKGGCSLSLTKVGGAVSAVEYAMANKGYVVGGLIPEESVKADNESAFKHTFMRMFGKATRLAEQGESVVLGTWVEYREDGTYIVFDLCDLFDKVKTMKVPLELAAKRGERAIYDLENEREIFINYGA